MGVVLETPRRRGVHVRPCCVWVSLDSCSLSHTGLVRSPIPRSEEVLCNPFRIAPRPGAKNTWKFCFSFLCCGRERILNRFRTAIMVFRYKLLGINVAYRYFLFM